jgi:ubiquinone/menaquinone biosynthesis C-methylase UbiE
LTARVRLERHDARRLPYADGAFPCVFSNSIVHHLADPAPVLAEMVRLTAAGGLLFVRDLLRPVDGAKLHHLLATYAAGANPHARQMFADSLRAALTVEEVRGLVAGLGLEPEDVRQTTDRHWTWAWRAGPRGSAIRG